MGEGEERIGGKEDAEKKFHSGNEKRRGRHNVARLTPSHFGRAARKGKSKVKKERVLSVVQYQYNKREAATLATITRTRFRPPSLSRKRSSRVAFAKKFPICGLRQEKKVPLEEINSFCGEKAFEEMNSFITIMRGESNLISFICDNGFLYKVCACSRKLISCVTHMDTGQDGQSAKGIIFVQSNAAFKVGGFSPIFPRRFLALDFGFVCSTRWKPGFA